MFDSETYRTFNKRFLKFGPKETALRSPRDRNYLHDGSDIIKTPKGVAKEFGILRFITIKFSSFFAFRSHFS